MMSVLFVGDESVLVIDRAGLDMLPPKQRAVVTYWTLRPNRAVSVDEGRCLFPNYAHVVYVEPPKPTKQPTTPRDIEHEDIRSERPCT